MKGIMRKDLRNLQIKVRKLDLFGEEKEKRVDLLESILMLLSIFQHVFQLDFNDIAYSSVS